MTIDVAIANLAASHLGEDVTVVSPDDTSKLARNVRAVWDEVRREVLRAHNWNFAMTRASLPALASTDPEYDADAINPWTYVYPLPTDYVRLAKIFDPALGKGEYQLENDGILCDEAGPLRIRYVYDRTEISAWDPKARKALALQIAWQIAPAMGVTGSKRERINRSYKEAIERARAVDAKENPPETLPAPSWVTARFGDGVTA
jgi:hypothetical protein